MNHNLRHLSAGVLALIFLSTSDIRSQDTAPAPAETSQLARSLSKAFGDVYEKVSPSVVVIEAQKIQIHPSASSQQMLQYFFRTPQGMRPLPDEYEGSPNQGSGFVLTKDGYILTNNHVLENADPSKIQVTLKDGRKLPAQLVGSDAPSDLAVLKIEAENLTVAEIGNSEQVRVGEFAFAIGSPFDLRYTFTFGVIGAIGRNNIIDGPDYEEYIQTDAAINPGNSGGPLVDIDGRVIGVNTLISGMNRGLGFAIPVNLATKIASQIIAQGRFMRPWLGIGIASVNEFDVLERMFDGMPRREIERIFGQFEKGVVVGGFDESAPETTRRVLRLGDVILRVDGTEVATSRDLQRVILGKSVGQDIELQISRDGKVQSVRIPTGERSNGIIRAALQQPPRNRPAPVPSPSIPSAPQAQSPMAGLEVRELTVDLARTMNLQPEAGVLVTAVEAGSAAEIAQIKVGDVITSVGSRPIRTAEDFEKSLGNVGDNGVMLHINRGDRRTFAILKP